MTYLPQRPLRGLGDDSEQDFFTKLLEQIKGLPAQIQATTGNDDGFFAQLQNEPASTTPAGGSTNFAQVGTVCKATNKTTLNAVSALQRQLNRVAKVKGFAPIAVDGEIGPLTMALFRQVNNATPGSLGDSGLTCMSLGLNLGNVGPLVKAFADSIGAPAAVAAPSPSAPPSFINPKTGQQIAAGSAGDLMAQVTSPLGLVAIGVAGLVLYRRSKKGKR